MIGPSNPIASIGPILALEGIRAAIRDSPAPVVAVSPLVGGAVLKGPTAAFMQWAGQPLTSAGVAGCYDGLLDGMVADEGTDVVPALITETLMDTAESRRNLAQRTLDFALGLS